MFYAAPDNFETWRVQARQFIFNHISPDQIAWTSPNAVQLTLFDKQALQEPDANFKFTVPKNFLTLAKKVACHRDIARWYLLYVLLWRITHGEKHVLAVSTDSIMHKLLLMQKAVGRDAHKMKAFVRFRLVQEDQQQQYIAWYQPDHRIAQLVAPFFQRRFSIMQWAILTPDESIYWNGEKLTFAAGVPASQAPNEDQLEELWRTYYRATFNPARIKIKAMKREMPVRFWHTLPETTIISELLQAAPARVEKMLQYQEGFADSAANFLPITKDLATLKIAAHKCQACDLHCKATQTVFGAGLEYAKLMFIGEQPGDEEDKLNQPFIGPAGKLLDKLFTEAEISRTDIYLTNAVKHFKNKLVNNRRIHVTPNIREINACRPWLAAEIDAIKPEKIICLGVIAARALLGNGVSLQDIRGKWHLSEWQIPVMVTYHPAAVLRMPNPIIKEQIYNTMIEDIKLAISG